MLDIRRRNEKDKIEKELREKGIEGEVDEASVCWLTGKYRMKGEEVRGDKSDNSVIAVNLVHACCLKLMNL